MLFSCLTSKFSLLSVELLCDLKFVVTSCVMSLIFLLLLLVCQIDIRVVSCLFLLLLVSNFVVNICQILLEMDVIRRRGCRRSGRSRINNSYSCLLLLFLELLLLSATRVVVVIFWGG